MYLSLILPITLRLFHSIHFIQAVREGSRRKVSGFLDLLPSDCFSTPSKLEGSRWRVIGFSGPSKMQSLNDSVTMKFLIIRHISRTLSLSVSIYLSISLSTSHPPSLSPSLSLPPSLFFLNLTKSLPLLIRNHHYNHHSANRGMVRTHSKTKDL